MGLLQVCNHIHLTQQINNSIVTTEMITVYFNSSLTLWLLRSFPVILPAYASALLHYTEYSCYVAAVVRWFVSQLHYTQDVLRRPHARSILYEGRL